MYRPADQCRYWRHSQRRPLFHARSIECVGCAGAFPRCFSALFHAGSIECVGCAGAVSTLLFVQTNQITDMSPSTKLGSNNVVRKASKSQSLFHARSIEREIRSGARFRLRSINSTELSRFICCETAVSNRRHCTSRPESLAARMSNHCEANDRGAGNKSSSHTGGFGRRNSPSCVNFVDRCLKFWKRHDFSTCFQCLLGAGQNHNLP